MHRRARTYLFAAVAALVFDTAAFAQEGPDTQTPAAAPAAPGESAMPAAGPGESATPVAAPEGTAGGAAAVASADTVAGNLSDPSHAMYGAAFRWRWVSVPGWFLNFFTQKNVPLSSFGSFALEGFRRKVDRDNPNRTWELDVGVGYQNMSPPDGYWLGKGGYKPENDTDLVQARNLSLITLDAAFVSRQYFGPYFGIHYGAGLGLGIVRGQVLRTSARQVGPGQYEVRDKNGNLLCDTSVKCNETGLNGTMTGPDNGPGDPHRFVETGVPGALPIINLLVGIDGRIPIPQYHQAVDIRLEGGFFDAFFIGMAVGYQM